MNKKVNISFEGFSIGSQDAGGKIVNVTTYDGLKNDRFYHDEPGLMEKVPNIKTKEEILRHFALLDEKEEVHGGVEEVYGAMELYKNQEVNACNDKYNALWNWIDKRISECVVAVNDLAYDYKRDAIQSELNTLIRVKSLSNGLSFNNVVRVREIPDAAVKLLDECKMTPKDDYDHNAHFFNKGIDVAIDIITAHNKNVKNG